MINRKCRAIKPFGRVDIRRRRTGGSRAVCVPSCVPSNVYAWVGQSTQSKENRTRSIRVEGVRRIIGAELKNSIDILNNANSNLLCYIPSIHTPVRRPLLATAPNLHNSSNPINTDPKWMVKGAGSFSSARPRPAQKANPDEC